MSRLILLRHGQSVWNQENRFTGFVDVELSEKGVQEAVLAGRALGNEAVDVVFTSVLKRAIDTADIVLREAHKDCLRLTSPALNERHYGDLQGLNKDEVRAQYGAEQVHVWRRSYDVAPPGGESLKQTCERVIPYFYSDIAPRLKRGQNVWVVAHGNSLRGLIKELEHLDDKQIVDVEIPTGVPIRYEIDADGKATNKLIYAIQEIL